MKKRYLFVIIILCFVFINYVHADMDAPQTLVYDAIVSDNEGIKYDGTCTAVDKNNNKVNCYKNSKTIIIPYDTKVTVNYEYVNDGVAYGSVSATFEQNDLTYTIQGKVRLDQLKVIEDFSLADDDVFQLKEKSTIMIASQNGVSMYNAPSTSFTKIDTIPYGTELTYEYGAIKNSQGINGLMWAYVDYNGNKGWIYTLNRGLGSDDDEIVAKIKGNNIVTIHDTKVYQSVGEDSKVLGTIPANKYIDTTKEALTFMSYGWYYVEYDGIKGWIHDVAVKSGATATITDSSSVKVYSSIKNNYTDDQLSDVLIPNGTVISNTYSYGSKFPYLRFEYEGKILWLKVEPIDDSGFKYEYGNYVSDSDNLLDEKNLPSGEEEKTTSQTKTSTKKESYKKVMMDQFTPQQIIIICVGGAIVVALTAFVTLKFVNKNKKITK